MQEEKNNVELSKSEKKDQLSSKDDIGKPKIIKHECKFCKTEFEGEPEYVAMRFFWHNYTKHYELFAANFLRELADRLFRGFSQI